MGTDVSACENILSFSLRNLLDPSTRRAWELQNNGADNLPMTDWIRFLEQRVTGLSMVPNSTSGRHTASGANNRPSTIQQPTVRSGIVRVNQTASSTPSKCACCHEDFYPIESCPKFLEFNPYQRTKRAQKRKLCLVV